MCCCAEEDPFQLEELEERAPPLPEEPPPVASTAPATEAEPKSEPRSNGVEKGSQHTEVGALHKLAKSFVTGQSSSQEMPWLLSLYPYRLEVSLRKCWVLAECWRKA